MITDQHAATVCKVGQGEACCRYLLMRPGTGWVCGKLDDPAIKAYLDDRVAKDTIRAKGDNCEGQP